MATIKDLYDKHSALAAKDGGPDALKVDANSQIDKSPYSVGLGGMGAADEGAINTLAKNQKKAPYAAKEGGNWYGINGSTIGTGTSFSDYTYINGTMARASSNDTDKYSSQMAPYRG